jgi:hypothetical protein
MLSTTTVCHMAVAQRAVAHKVAIKPNHQAKWHGKVYRRLLALPIYLYISFSRIAR